MITRFHVQSFKALRDVSLALTPIHVLIGPNDSGKTSILGALAALSRSTDLNLRQSFTGSWDGRELVWHGDADGVVCLTADMTVAAEALRYSLACRFPNAGRAVRVEWESITRGVEIKFGNVDHEKSRVAAVCIDNVLELVEAMEGCHLVHEGLSGVSYFRWNPRAMALPVAPDSARQFRLNSDGFGLALLVDDILGADRKKFDTLEARLVSIFPEIAAIRLVRQMAFRAPPDDIEGVSRLDQADGKGLAFELRGTGKVVPASQVSDGLMLVLGYLAVLHSPRPPRLLLIEEPENGVHPKRLQEVLKILRELVQAQSHTQVVLTTHSPYAVDFFAPEEVTLCTKGKDGSIETTRMSDSSAVREQASLFSLGEIWTAEGDEGLVERAPAGSTAR